MKDEAPDVPAAIDDLAPYVYAYLQAKAKQEEFSARAKEWETAANSVRDIITSTLDAKGANLGTVADKPVIRWTRYAQDSFDSKAFREKEPDLAAIYTKQVERTRFTAYRSVEDD